MNAALTPDADLHYTRGMLHLRRGEAILPYSMALREDKVPPGADVLLALLGLATVATSKALGQTGWIEAYREEMRQAIAQFERAHELAPEFADIAYRLAQAHRYLGDADDACTWAREAVALAPENEDYGGLLRVLEGGRPSGVSPQFRPASMTQVRSVPGVSSSLTWDDVILPARTKRELRQVQLVLENPEQARRLGVEPPTGLLLYGPPGTGKTTVARVLAAQARCRFFATSPAEINSLWVGESEKAVQRLFADARSATPAIVFLDEIDALLPTRAGGMHQYSDKVVNQFLHEMDGLVANQGIFVVGATNRPDMLDPALLRGGRLSRQIEIPLPDEAGRRALLGLQTRTARLSPAVDLETIARQATGFSGADLRALVNEAGLQAMIRIADDGGESAVTVGDFAIALENLRKI